MIASRRRLRWVTAGSLWLVLALVAITWRAATEAAPPLSIHRTLASHLRLPGRAPVLAWPRAGEAAIEVQGIGGITSSAKLAPVPIASVAKVMTAYLTLREHPLAPGAEGFTMTITPADVAEQEQRAALLQSTLRVKAGERITERQALQALLLPSANNIAELLAVHDAGTTPAFVARMNAAARALHMGSTTYTDPSGFEDTTVSTAVNQLLLARAAMREPAFAAIVDERSAELPLVGSVANYDALLGRDGYEGIKTGSDRAAGGCFMFVKRISIGGRRLSVLGVVLGQREGALIEAALASAQRLGDSVAAALHVQTVLPAGTSVVSISNADGSRTTGATTAALRALGWGGLELPVRVTVGPTATRLRSGQRVATVAVENSDALPVTVVTTHALGGPSLGWRLLHLL
jgi:serine-type D-Ala-D-Ala carboxypeptidase (penicillin-binding protein 5/6)